MGNPSEEEETIQGQFQELAVGRGRKQRSGRREDTIWWDPFDGEKGVLKVGVDSKRNSQMTINDRRLTRKETKPSIRIAVIKKIDASLNSGQ